MTDNRPQQRDIITKRWRKVSAQQPLEFQTQIAVVEYIKIMAFPHVRWRAIENDGLLDKRVAAKRKAKGIKPGWPDLEFHKYDSINDARTSLGLELKRKNGVLSDAQIAVRDNDFPVIGWIYEVADTFDGAIEILERHGMVRPRHAGWLR